MSNYGKDTNNSQFFITRTDCPNLDGTHVVFGHVLRGLDIIGEMEKVANDDGTTTAEITIVCSGELKGEQPDEWNYYDMDDNLPPFPADWIESSQYTNQAPDIILPLLERMKRLGNGFYDKKDFVSALRKYKKVGRYHQFIVDAQANAGTEFATLITTDTIANLRLNNLLNMAACHLKLGQYRHVVAVCDEVLKSRTDQSKAYYRRGVALIELKEYEKSLEDLKKAHALSPNDPNVVSQFNRGKQLLLAYRKEERAVSEKIFKALHL